MKSHKVADFRNVQKKKMQLVIPCDYEVAAETKGDGYGRLLARARTSVSHSTAAKTKAHSSSFLPNRCQPSATQRLTHPLYQARPSWCILLGARRSGVFSSPDLRRAVPSTKYALRSRTASGRHGCFAINSTSTSFFSRTWRRESSLPSRLTLLIGDQATTDVCQSKLHYCGPGKSHWSRLVVVIFRLGVG
jgi:hypothetical protein